MRPHHEGRITNGVAYPAAVLALRGRYDFRSIGGASAGAIAAAVTATAGVAAGVLDLVENPALLRQQRTGASTTAILVARTAAQWKFGLLLVAVLAVFSGFGCVQLAGCDRGRPPLRPTEPSGSAVRT